MESILEQIRVEFQKKRDLEIEQKEKILRLENENLLLRNIIKYIEQYELLYYIKQEKASTNECNESRQEKTKCNICHNLLEAPSNLYFTDLPESSDQTSSIKTPPNLVINNFS